MLHRFVLIQETFISYKMNQHTSNIIATCTNDIIKQHKTKEPSSPQAFNSPSSTAATSFFLGMMKIKKRLSSVSSAAFTQSTTPSRLALLCLGSPPAPNSGIWLCRHYDDCCMWPTLNRCCWVGAVKFWKAKVIHCCLSSREAVPGCVTIMFYCHYTEVVIYSWGSCQAWEVKKHLVGHHLARLDSCFLLCFS